MAKIFTKRTRGIAKTIGKGVLAGGIKAGRFLGRVSENVARNIEKERRESRELKLEKLPVQKKAVLKRRKILVPIEQGMSAREFFKMKLPTDF